jgi:SPW repeat-containing protein
MTNEPMDTGVSGVSATGGAPVGGARAASILCLLAGIWFFISPWVYGTVASANSWNNWIVGAAIFIVGCARVSRPAYSTALSWVNVVLGIWVFFSPWIYAYTGDQGRFINSLCVGVIVFVLSIIAARITVSAPGAAGHRTDASVHP